MKPPLWWERWLGVRLTIFGTGSAVLRANALRRAGLLETEDDASDSDDSGDGQGPERDSHRIRGHRHEPDAAPAGRVHHRVQQPARAGAVTSRDHA